MRASQSVVRVGDIGRVCGNRCVRWDLSARPFGPESGRRETGVPPPLRQPLDGWAGGSPVSRLPATGSNHLFSPLDATIGEIADLDELGEHP
jgi:hypothetical protein